jgi:galactose mutarotase-like enzyme
MATIQALEAVAAPTRWRLTEGAAQVEVAPERGALVTQFQVGGDDVLFLDEGTFRDRSKNVRGGVPLLFPFAGKPPPGSTLVQHGFARKAAWAVTGSSAGPQTARLACRLESSPETLAAWPYPFRCDFVTSLTAGRLRLEWAFHNPGATPMPLHFGLHPYFRAPDKAKARAEVGLTRAFDNRLGQERDVGPLDFGGEELDLHFTPYRREGITLERGDGRRVGLAWSRQFTTLVFWTLPGQPFICVEPWTAQGARPSLLEVAPGATEALHVECWLE